MSDTAWDGLLGPGERLLRDGAPLPGLHRRGKSLFLMALGLPFLLIGMAIFAFGLHRPGQAMSASDAGLVVFFTAFAFPFAGFGGLLFPGPLVRARTAHRRVRDAPSICAAYVARATLGQRVAVYPILPSTALEPERGKRADNVRLHARRERDLEGDLGTVRAGFENIADGAAVYRLIRQIQAEKS